MSQVDTRWIDKLQATASRRQIQVHAYACPNTKNNSNHIHTNSAKRGHVRSLSERWACVHTYIYTHKFFKVSVCTLSYKQKFFHWFTTCISHICISHAFTSTHRHACISHAFTSTHLVTEISAGASDMAPIPQACMYLTHIHNNTQACMYLTRIHINTQPHGT